MNNIETNLLTLFAPSTVRALLNGNRTPSYKKMLLMLDRFQIPLEAWRDIKSFMAHHNAQKTINQGIGGK